MRYIPELPPVDIERLTEWTYRELLRLSGEIERDANEVNTEFLIDVQRGEKTGFSMVHKFGKNNGVPNGSWEHISLTPFATANFRQSAISMRVKAGGNAADTVAGAGARKVTIQGIDSNLAELAEEIDLAGGSASAATTATFWRVHRAWVSSAGTYGAANTGNIVIEDSGGGADFLSIVAGEGQSQYAGWTVPADKKAYLLHVHVTVDAGKAADVRCFIRENIDDVSAPVDAKRLKLYWDGVLGSLHYAPKGPELVISEKSDIWFEAQGGGAGTEVSCDFELLVEDV